MSVRSRARRSNLGWFAQAFHHGVLWHPVALFLKMDVKMPEVYRSVRSRSLQRSFGCDELTRERRAASA